MQVLADADSCGLGLDQVRSSRPVCTHETHAMLFRRAALLPHGMLCIANALHRALHGGAVRTCAMPASQPRAALAPYSLPGCGLAAPVAAQRSQLFVLRLDTARGGACAAVQAAPVVAGRAGGHRWAVMLH